jgi:hypothetical protein
MKAPRATVRFAQVVAAAGQPEPVTLWVEPRLDKRFQTALRQNRVATVNQETVGSKKDFAMVGFHRGKHSSYWIFPKPLDAFEGKRIIGIDYQQLKATSSLEPAELSPRKKLTKSRRSVRQSKAVGSRRRKQPSNPADG